MKRFVTVLSLLALTAAGAFAQGFQTGHITGTVSDETGGALPGVTVTVTSEERGLTRSDTTDSSGQYRFAALPLGTYTVEAALSGFQNMSRRAVRVEAEKTTTVDFSLRLAAAAEEITVTAAAPVVDPTNVTQTTRISDEEFQKAPVGRNFQALVQMAPGTSEGTGSDANPNVNGALSWNNQYLFDGVDTTDPTTGTFVSNLNFEAIQEVNVYTTGISAEYGRATGAVVNVITKSGSNDFEGSLKAIAINDEWNEQNKTRNMLTGASLARQKVDEINTRYNVTLGGPILRDRLFFFGSYETYEPVGARQTTTFTNEEYQENVVLEFPAYRLTAQITPSHQIWGKYSEDPLTGLLRQYTEATDLYTLTQQDQGGEQMAVQYSGVFGNNFALDAMYGESESILFVQPYRIGPFDNGSAVFDLTRGRYFNGNFFGVGNNTSRPREQATVAATYFADWANVNHDLKAGVDIHSIESSSYLSWGNNRLYVVRNYNPATGAFTPVQRRDYDDPGPQVSAGEITSIYLRDKMNFGRLFLEAGVRLEDQTSENDVGETVVDAQSVAPRLAASYDLTGNGRTILTATAGRYHDFITQGLADSMAEKASRANYDLFTWNATTQQYDFVRTVITAGGSSINPNLDLKPPQMDEFTLGFQQQLGRLMGFGIRGIWREWDDLIEDFYRFDEDLNIITDVVNYPDARNEYVSVQGMFEKRFSNNWALMANYTWSDTETNQTDNPGVYFYLLNDFPTNMCRSADATVGDIPCIEAERTLFGTPSYGREHIFNLLGTYGFNLGPVNLTFGAVGEYMSGAHYSRSSTLAVLTPDGEDSGETFTYFYGGRGSAQLPDLWFIDTSLEATYRIWRDVELGLKGEIFNVTDEQEQDNVNRTAWCEDDSASCQTLRNEFGAATARGSFQDPRAYRVTALIRF